MKSSIPKYCKLSLICIILSFGSTLAAQSYLKSYELHGNGKADLESYMGCDYKKLFLNNGNEAIQFKSWPLFIYAPEEFRQWSEGKYLLESEAYESKTNSRLFFDIRFNTINAKKIYGSIAHKAPFKLNGQSGESVFLENIEKDKSRISKEKNTSHYQNVILLDKQELRELSKNNIVKLGAEWQIACQEFEVHNNSLIKNQLNCLSKIK